MTSEADKKGKGGARPGAGRKKRENAVELIDGRTVTGQQHAQWLIDQLNAPYSPKKPETLETAGWRRLWDSLDKRIALETRRYLYDRAKGKATVTVNHLHDKPIEMNVNLSMAELVRKVRQRKQEYERSRN